MLRTLVYENEFSTSPVGSGPFVINVMQKGDATDAFSQVIYLNRNNKYYGQNTKLANYTLKVYDSTDDIIAALKNGSVRGTASLGVSAAEQRYIAGLKAFVHEHPILTFYKAKDIDALYDKVMTFEIPEVENTYKFKTSTKRIIEDNNE